MSNHHYQLPFRLEAAGITQHEQENAEHIKSRLKKQAVVLAGVLAAAILISYLPSVFTDSGDVLKTGRMILNLLFIVLFIRTAFFFFIFLAKNKKDYTGGYIEVYSDHISVRQRSAFINNDSWESAEIWYKDLVRMWVTTDKSNSHYLRLNREIERYTDGICFEYKIGRSSNSISAANWGARQGTAVFRLNCDGYAKTAVLDAAHAVFNAARTFNSDLEYRMP